MKSNFEKLYYFLNKTNFSWHYLIKFKPNRLNFREENIPDKEIYLWENQDKIHCGF